MVLARDLPDNQALQHLTARIWENGGVVAAVCHGPASLVNVRLSSGNWLVDGREVNSITDSEENAVENDGVVPFLLKSKLRERGAPLTGADNFQADVARDGRLVTGQNPASTHGVGEVILERLETRNRAA